MRLMQELVLMNPQIRPWQVNALEALTVPECYLLALLNA